MFVCVAWYKEMKSLRSYIALLRLHQWLKNLLLLFPPFFGGRLSIHAIVGSFVPAFLSFSLAASCTYIINDMIDRKADRNHASKKNRPLARGDVPLPYAAIFAGVLYMASMLLAAGVSEHFLGYLILYLLLSISYSLFFKNIVLIDIFAIASGYVLRVMAGGEAFRVPVSNWLFITVFIVALFLAAGKRLGELVAEDVNAIKHRHILSEYSASFLEGMLWFAASASLVAYALYVIENRDVMLYTVPIAAYGLLRYIYVVKRGRGDPTDVLLNDRHIMITGLVWAAMVGMIIYR
jgi:decaprenyl-phosphate phosphoribosyltransferase